MFVGYLLFLRMFQPKEIKQFKNSLLLSNKEKPNYSEYKDSVLRTILNYSIIAIFILLTVVPAVLIATGCNKGVEALVSGIFAFLFSDIYLFNYAFRKFVLKESGYCKM
jgi:hypothetical protein